MKLNHVTPARLRAASLVVLLVVVLIFLWPALREFNLIQMDYLQYWAAGYQTLRSQDPYLYETTAEIYREIANSVPNESFLYPPWLIAILLPFSLLPIQASRLVWYFLGFGMLFFAVDRVWALYAGPKNLRWIAMLLAITFSPAIFALTLGQLSPFTFAGMVLFLWVLRLPESKRWKYLVAGMGAALMALKPQGFYLFWVALLLWTFHRRELRVISGTFLLLGTATIAVSLFVPNIFFSFLTTSLKNQPNLYCTPTIGYWLREIFGAEKFSLQFVAPMLGVGWLVAFWQRKKEAWDWTVQMPVLAFVSLITSPFSWTHDQVILLLPLLEVVVLVVNAPDRKLLKALILAWLVLNTGMIVLHFWYPDCWFIWQAPFWLVIYWIIKKLITRKSKTSAP
jgi:hypothetical protein